MLAIKRNTITLFEYHEASTSILKLNLIAKPRTKKASLKDHVERLKLSSRERREPVSVFRSIGPDPGTR